MLVLYGINDAEESFGGLTHLAILTKDEALEDLELSDFIRYDDEPARFENRLVVVDSFTDLARVGNRTIAEYIGDELVANFLEDNPEQFYPLLPGPEVAYVGRLPNGYLRARASAEGWYVEAVNSLSDKSGVILASGQTDSEVQAKATALKVARKVLGSLH
jgi:hypothetical protein